MSRKSRTPDDTLDGPRRSRLPIELFTSPTPNGHRISIALEEMGLFYNVREIKLGQSQQKEDWFVAIK
jgi:hypothetical protein